ncbi:MAG TPA: type I phosphomannose isomerase catalytic subunit [Tepidisphaeraceae bacterium]
MALYPMLFQPRYLEKIWGGCKLETLGKKGLPAEKLIGESWELFDFPPGVVENSPDWVSSVIANGPLAGRTLHGVIEEFGTDLHGDVPLLGPHGQFPVLVKFLDAREHLSVQVHPDQDYVNTHPEAHLKSEAWYVLQSDPGAALFKGMRPGVTREQFKAAVEAGTVEGLLRKIPTKPGQCFYLPSGTVHALGAGIVVAEVQTPSDTTFRVFDFNRVDPATGRPRALQVAEALQCINFNPEPPERPRSHVAGFFTTVSQLVSSPYFKIEKVRFIEGIEEPVPYDEPVVWIMLEGQAEVKVDGIKEPTRFTRGDTVLIPAKMKNPMIKTVTDCVWLEVTFPTKSDS